MGLFKKDKGIRGTAQIVGCSAHRGEGAWQSCRMQLVVQVEGREPYSAEANQIAPRKKWPQPGMTVPVKVDEKNPSKVKVDFDEMPTGKERARQMAEQHAAAMRGQPGMLGDAGAAGAAGGMGAMQAMPGQVNIVGDISQVSPEQLARLEQMTGMDLDGDGTVGGAPTASGGAGGDDRVTQLERLAQLRASGALSDSEFEQEKRRLLGG